MQWGQLYQRLEALTLKVRPAWAPSAEFALVRSETTTISSRGSPEAPGTTSTALQLPLCTLIQRTELERAKVSEVTLPERLRCSSCSQSPMLSRAGSSEAALKYMMGSEGPGASPGAERVAWGPGAAGEAALGATPPLSAALTSAAGLKNII